MTTTALLLVLTSAVLHATWNYWGKKYDPSAAFFWLANTTGMIVFLPLLIYQWQMLLDLTPTVWGLVTASGAFLALYFIALGSSYRCGELSIAYPLARSSPIIVVVVTTCILGKGHEIRWNCGVGCVLVVVGCFLVPLKEFRQFNWSNYICASCGLAFLAACGTAGYSMIDDEALRCLHRASASASTSAATPTLTTLTYAGLQTVTCALFSSVFILLRRSHRLQLIHVWQNARTGGIGAGLTIVVTYSLVLSAMGFANNISYVVAFRQVSIPIGVAIGAVLLRERVPAPRWVGVAVMLLGLTLVAWR